MTIAHISDVHFGRIAHADIVQSIVDEINDHKPALVVVSGDLTQRARRRQFAEAAKMIKSFEAEVLVVPGNHDVAAWYRPFQRVSRPLRRYMKYISEDLSPAFADGRIAAFGINSAHGMTIKGGRIRSKDIAEMKEFFQEHNGAFRILAVHHHLVRLRALGSHDVARNGAKALQEAAACGVEIVLCGHLHQSHVDTVAVEANGHQIIIASAGTATSSRGRREDRLVNYYNYVTADKAQILIEERQFDLATRKFSTVRKASFPRRNAA